MGETAHIQNTEIVEKLEETLVNFGARHQKLVLKFRQGMGLDEKNKSIRKALKGTGEFFICEQPFEMTPQERLYNLFYWANRFVKDDEVANWLKEQESPSLPEGLSPISSNILLAYYAMNEPAIIPEIKLFVKELQENVFKSVRDGHSHTDIILTLEKFDFTYPFIGEPR
ncbi:MAG: hypothetical protein UX13_C0004G0016 [Candidatus Woesebacteria bacterium GW2011_GWB1_45_5]|uniref:Uncharacterized protein n=1 Tax=Candidatus Woesebacteria bacterium GW2011_GWB1_45_5 TaxID=1618581 RepID=A0A0G1MRF2_9BACT|nr:MAG: hypothetical protein UX13_C0004G0016 [Candidatus Woesebacteria bacterium GW2011_GWB1_45_5]